MAKNNYFKKVNGEELISPMGWLKIIIIAVLSPNDLLEGEYDIYDNLLNDLCELLEQRGCTRNKERLYAYILDFESIKEIENFIETIYGTWICGYDVWKLGKTPNN